MAQSEITEPVSVLDEAGRPLNFGWARQPLFFYDHNLIKAPRRSISEYDRYLLLSGTHTVLLEIMDDGYLGYLFMSVLSFGKKTRSTQTFLTSFSLGCFDLPASSEKGSIKYTHKKTLLNFAAMESGARIIKVDFPKFGHHRSLRGEVVLSPPPEAESIATNMSWRGKGNAFLYARRSPWYIAEGVIQFGAAEIVFTRGSGWGIFDWGRGVRPRADLSFWAAASGVKGDTQSSFTVGFNTADAGMGTENAFFIGGKLHKLDQVSFHIPSGKLLPWRFTSNDGRLEMIFTPHQERDENHKMFLYSLNRRQLFGTFSGTVILDDGTPFTFTDLSGMTERRKSRR